MFSKYFLLLAGLFLTRSWPFFPIYSSESEKSCPPQRPSPGSLTWFPPRISCSTLCVRWDSAGRVPDGVGVGVYKPHISQSLRIPFSAFLSYLMVLEAPPCHSLSPSWESCFPLVLCPLQEEMFGGHISHPP